MITRFPEQNKTPFTNFIYLILLNISLILLIFKLFYNMLRFVNNKICTFNKIRKPEAVNRTRTTS